jgi:hypothetical protein
MKDPNAERLLRRQKTFASAIKQLLKEEYQMLAGDRIQDMFVKDLMGVYGRYMKDAWHLDAGQVSWFAVHKDEFPRRGKTIENTKMVPVILTLAAEEDLKMKMNGWTAKDVRRHRVARLCREAFEQSEVVTQSDLAHLLGVSAGTVGKDIREYQIENTVVLPYRGSIHDMGPTTTHKDVIVTMIESGIPTLEVASRTHHSPEACDRYYKAFKKVRKLHEDGLAPEVIAAELEMSKRLVLQYVEIIRRLRRKAEEAAKMQTKDATKEVAG